MPNNCKRSLPHTDPIVSMSRTVLKALAERPEIGEMKFPAAPALKSSSVRENFYL
jgi:hypothetical protein